VTDALSHFVEVTWQPEIARLRVGRVVTVIDAGRIINPLAGRNQIAGGVVMGIGMAICEHTSYDPQNGAPSPAKANAFSMLRDFCALWISSSTSPS
jgi:CO/xanthine dehydrogenase Mo-binding subunit